MEIIILFLLSVPLLNSTMVCAMNNQVANNPTRIRNDIVPPDNYSVVIQKMIDGKEQYKDAVEGNLFMFENEHPRVDANSFGHVVFKFRSGNKLFASLRKIDRYQNFGQDGHGNCHRTSYICKIAREGYPLRVEIPLSHYTRETTLQGGTLRIEFLNHLGILFVGETEKITAAVPLPYKKRKTSVPSGPGSSQNDPIFLDL